MTGCGGRQVDLLHCQQLQDGGRDAGWAALLHEGQHEKIHSVTEQSVIMLGVNCMKYIKIKTLYKV